MELGKGDWMKHLCKRLRHGHSSRPFLYEIKLDKAVRIIWEEAIELLSRGEKENLYFIEVIRLWDLVVDHDKIHSSIQNILQSYGRGKELPKLQKIDEGNRHNDPNLRTPQIYLHVDPKSKENDVDTHCLYKPVNPHENEFNVMKFYNFSSDVVRNILDESDIRVDFPFKVNDDECLFINMKAETPILLLGRSGTGKTTCCIYRLWSKFEVYWTEIQRLQCSEVSAAEFIRKLLFVCLFICFQAHEHFSQYGGSYFYR
jgi:hypothetical protein